MRSKFLLLILLFPLTMVACGNEETPTPSPRVGGSGVYSFVVEEDGNSYRCFQSKDYRGGLWCTEREEDNVLR